MSISTQNRCRIAMREHLRSGGLRPFGLAVASILVGACGNSNEASAGPTNGAGATGGATVSTVATGVGGALNTGGSFSSGGASVSSVQTGGAASGGTSGIGVGGANTGGSNSPTGGALATGGSRSTTNGTGGKANVGGSSATGGLNATGGVAATGGNPGTGTTGGKSTGGVAATGGNKATGGTAATGGATATGGSSSTSTCTPSSTKFSFFVTSQARLFALAQAFNGSTKGFGGDLRYGQTTGLEGADKICTAIAEASMPGNCKTWRAFLSVADGGNGTQVNAISRIGNGPWYDRLGRLFGTNTTTINATRPDAASAIVNDFPNEDGVLNHDALQTGNTTNQDNHDMLTGSTTSGTLYGANAHCTNWTSSAADTSKKPRVGHSWPAMSGQSWMSVLDESGCAPGYNLIDTGGPGKDGTVGSGGGYGGFYCFALTP